MLVLTNSKIFDGVTSELRIGQNVCVEGSRITAVSGELPTCDTAEIVDCGGLTLMPGLIDAHVHAYGYTLDLRRGEAPVTYVSCWATYMLGRMLDRGFTTVRDTGGGDCGLYLALQEGIISGPRFFYCGRGLSQTGGHFDFRNPHTHNAHEDHCLSCGCAHINLAGAVVDGVDAIRRVVRDNFRTGASFIKFAGGGGVLTMGDKLDSMQFSDEEVRAIVDEVERHDAYCTAHIHTDRALQRMVRLGVHCIEHGTLIESTTARMVADKGVYVVPTLAIAAALARDGDALGYPPQSAGKLALMQDRGSRSLEYMKSAGVKLGFGTDLVGATERYQCTEFALRKAVFTPYEILVQATSMNAEIIGATGELGVIREGANADLLLVEGNPLEDISVLERDGAALAFIIKAGQFHKRRPFTRERHLR